MVLSIFGPKIASFNEIIEGIQCPPLFIAQLKQDEHGFNHCSKYTNLLSIFLSHWEDITPQWISVRTFCSKFFTHGLIDNDCAEILQNSLPYSFPQLRADELVHEVLGTSCHHHHYYWHLRQRNQDIHPQSFHLSLSSSMSLQGFHRDPVAIFWEKILVGRKPLY